MDLGPRNRGKGGGGSSPQPRLKISPTNFSHLPPTCVPVKKMLYVAGMNDEKSRLTAALFGILEDPTLPSRDRVEASKILMLLVLGDVAAAVEKSPLALTVS